MITLKSIGIGAGLIAGAGGLTGAVCYSTGLFDSNTQITKLLEKENKHVLLVSEDNAGWTKALANYRLNSPWGKINATTDNQAIKELQALCSSKSKGSAYDTNDKAYIEITKYCSRDKTIKDVLGKEFKLLDTDNAVDEWKNRFDNYKAATNKLKLPDVNIASGDTKENHHSKLSTGCKNAVNRKTTESNYENTLAAVKEWCKANQLDT